MTTYEILLNKGRKEGIEIGVVQGIEQKTLSTVESCHKEGLPTELTARIANLSREEVKVIFKKLDQNTLK